MWVKEGSKRICTGGVQMGEGVGVYLKRTILSVSRNGSDYCEKDKKRMKLIWFLGS